MEKLLVFNARCAISSGENCNALQNRYLQHSLSRTHVNIHDNGSSDDRQACERHSLMLICISTLLQSRAAARRGEARLWEHGAFAYTRKASSLREKPSRRGGSQSCPRQLHGLPQRTGHGVNQIHHRGGSNRHRLFLVGTSEHDSRIQSSRLQNKPTSHQEIRNGPENSLVAFLWRLVLRQPAMP